MPVFIDVVVKTLTAQPIIVFFLLSEVSVFHSRVFKVTINERLINRCQVYVGVVDNELPGGQHYASLAVFRVKGQG